MAGAFSGTHLNSLNELTKTPHIGCFRNGEAANDSARLQGYNDWKVEMAHDAGFAWLSLT